MWALKWQVRTSPHTVAEIWNLKYQAEFREEFPLRQFCNWDFMCSAPCHWLLLQEQTWRAVGHDSLCVGVVAVGEDVGFLVVKPGRTRDGNIWLEGSNLQTCEVVKDCKPRFSSKNKEKKKKKLHHVKKQPVILTRGCTIKHFKIINSERLLIDLIYVCFGICWVFRFSPAVFVQSSSFAEAQKSVTSSSWRRRCYHQERSQRLACTLPVHVHTLCFFQLGSLTLKVLGS